jgi:hypothetical protein
LVSFRYDIPKHLRKLAEGTGKKPVITVYPNAFHAVRSLVDFEYDVFPRTVKNYRKRLQKLQSLADALRDELSENVSTLTCGRVEISLFKLESDTDFFRLSRFIARSQLKKVQMIKVPVVEVFKNLEAVSQFPSVVGTDSDPVTATDEQNMAILSNMCGLWTWKFKKHLRKDLNVNSVPTSQSPEPGSFAPTKLFAALSDAEKTELLSWYVGKRYTKTGNRFCYRTWDTKGGKFKKTIRPVSNGSYSTAEDAAEAILEWAVEVKVWSPKDPRGSETFWFSKLTMLMRNRIANEAR